MDARRSNVTDAETTEGTRTTTAKLHFLRITRPPPGTSHGIMPQTLAVRRGQPLTRRTVGLFMVSALARCLLAGARARSRARDGARAGARRGPSLASGSRARRPR